MRSAQSRHQQPGRACCLPLSATRSRLHMCRQVDHASRRAAKFRCDRLCRPRILEPALIVHNCSCAAIQASRTRRRHDLLIGMDPCSGAWAAVRLDVRGRFRARPRVRRAPPARAASAAASLPPPPEVAPAAAVEPEPDSIALARLDPGEGHLFRCSGSPRWLDFS